MFHSLEIDSEVTFDFPFRLKIRRLKGGTLEPHPTENAIILNYTVEATVFGDPGDKMVEESKVSLALKTLFL